MKLGMVRTRLEKIKIVRKIILNIFIYVVYYFFWVKNSFKDIFYNKSVLRHKFSRISERMIGFINTDISIRTNSFATSPIYVVSSKMRLSIFFNSFFGVFFTKKMATMVFTNLYTIFKRTFTINHAFMIAFRRTKNLFISSLSSRAGFKDIITHRTFVYHGSSIADDVTLVK